MISNECRAKKNFQFFNKNSVAVGANAQLVLKSLMELHPLVAEPDDVRKRKLCEANLQVGDLDRTLFADWTCSRQSA
jgi:hypothetical protein